MNNIRLDLMVIDPNAPEADVYEGYEDICEAWKEYIVFCDTELSSGDENRYDRAYRTNFIVLIDSVTRVVYGIRDYGRYSLNAEDILFVTPYIPMCKDPILNSLQLAEHVDLLMTLFQEEISSMYALSSNPLFLIQHELDGSNFLAWSLTEHNALYVYGYEGYPDYFFIAQLDDPDHFEENTKYTIVPPSYDLVNKLGLFYALSSSDLYD